VPTLLAAASCATQGASTAAIEPPAHHEKDGYRNLAPHDEHGFFDFLKWRLGGGPEEAPGVPADQLPKFVPPIVTPDLEAIGRPQGDAIQITWIGHASFLIQVGGLNVLTDPMFSERASPVGFAGPRRLAPPGIALKDLPRIDAVIISHNHYDHLDSDSVTALGNGPRYFVPPGFEPWLKRRGITNVQELDWWGSAEHRGLRFHAVPVQHFSSRTLFDRNEMLWSGWVIETTAGRIFFAGDTGYAPLFQEIGKRFGPIRLSLIPIGAYSPRWFMRAMHVDPPEAVRIHQDVRSEQSVGMHFATFELASEHLSEPPVYLEKALEEAGIPREKFIVMKIGETGVFRPGAREVVASPATK
jgi:L-ascorbate metabolism protein UlaG (beta-lactamase superfamily)